MSDKVILKAKVDGSKKNFQVSPSDTIVKLLHKKINEIDLSGIGALESLEELSLRGNKIVQLDLSPLKTCNNLKHLSISDNELATIDLQPLSECKSLEWLSVSNNALTHVDLYPLASCQKLRFLYISGNAMQSIDLFPLHVLNNLTELTLHMSRRRTTETGRYLRTDSYHLNPYLDPILGCENLMIVDVGYNEGFILNDIPEDPSTGIERLLKEGRRGSDPTLDMFGHAMSVSGVDKVWSVYQGKIDGSAPIDFPNQKREVFDAFDIGPYSGYDGSLDDLVIASDDFDDVKQKLKEAVVEQSIEQIENQGSTHFFDVDNLESDTASSAKLLALLVEARTTEIQDTPLYAYGGLIDLRPLWCTNYGYEIMKAMKYWIFTGPKGAIKLKEKFAEAGYVLQEPTEEGGPEKCERPFSAQLKNHILTVALSGTNKDEATGLVYQTGVPHIMRYNDFFE